MVRAFEVQRDWAQSVLRHVIFTCEQLPILNKWRDSVPTGSRLHAFLALEVIPFIDSEGSKAIKDRTQSLLTEHLDPAMSWTMHAGVLGVTIDATAGYLEDIRVSDTKQANLLSEFIVACVGAIDEDEDIPDASSLSRAMPKYTGTSSGKKKAQRAQRKRRKGERTQQQQALNRQKWSDRRLSPATILTRARKWLSDAIETLPSHRVRESHDQDHAGTTAFEAKLLALALHYLVTRLGLREQEASEFVYETHERALGQQYLEGVLSMVGLFEEAHLDEATGRTPAEWKKLTVAAEKRYFETYEAFGIGHDVLVTAMSLPHMPLPQKAPASPPVEGQAPLVIGPAIECDPRYTRTLGEIPMRLRWGVSLPQYPGPGGKEARTESCHIDFVAKRKYVDGELRAVELDFNEVQDCWFCTIGKWREPFAPTLDEFTLVAGGKRTMPVTSFCAWRKQKFNLMLASCPGTELAAPVFGDAGRLVLRWVLTGAPDDRLTGMMQTKWLRLRGTVFFSNWCAARGLSGDSFVHQLTHYLIERILPGFDPVLFAMGNIVDDEQLCAYPVSAEDMELVKQGLLALLGWHPELAGAFVSELLGLQLWDQTNLSALTFRELIGDMSAKGSSATAADAVQVYQALVVSIDGFDAELFKAKMAEGFDSACEGDGDRLSDRRLNPALRHWLKDQWPRHGRHILSLVSTLATFVDEGGRHYYHLDPDYPWVPAFWDWVKSSRFLGDDWPHYNGKPVFVGLGHQHQQHWEHMMIRAAVARLGPKEAYTTEMKKAEAMRAKFEATPVPIFVKPGSHSLIGAAGYAVGTPFGEEGAFVLLLGINEGKDKYKVVLLDSPLHQLAAVEGVTMALDWVTINSEDFRLFKLDFAQQALLRTYGKHTVLHGMLTPRYEGKPVTLCTGAGEWGFLRPGLVKSGPNRGFTVLKAACKLRDGARSRPFAVPVYNLELFLPSVGVGKLAPPTLTNLEHRLVAGFVTSSCTDKPEHMRDIAQRWNDQVGRGVEDQLRAMTQLPEGSTCLAYVPMHDPATATITKVPIQFHKLSNLHHALEEHWELYLDANPYLQRHASLGPYYTRAPDATSSTLPTAPCKSTFGLGTVIGGEVPSAKPDGGGNRPDKEELPSAAAVPMPTTDAPVASPAINAVALPVATTSGLALGLPQLQQCVDDAWRLTLQEMLVGDGSECRWTEHLITAVALVELVGGDFGPIATVMSTPGDVVLPAAWTERECTPAALCAMITTLLTLSRELWPPYEGPPLPFGVRGATDAPPTPAQIVELVRTELERMDRLAGSPSLFRAACTAGLLEARPSGYVLTQAPPPLSLIGLTCLATCVTSLGL